MAYNGLLPVYKEKGYTSFDVVACLRKILNQKKIGHTGTLDPDACGVLPVCLGNATRLADMLTDSGKTYRATMLLGVRTDTQDLSGNVLEEKEPVSDSLRIEEALFSFVGKYDQVPPMYSALKVDGKKLCDLARQGIEVERKPRTVEIYGIEIHSIKDALVDFTVECSKGTYIRTLIDDVGVKLGCGACMKELLRTKSGGFSLDDCLKLSDIERAVHTSEINNIIIKPDAVFKDLPGINTLAEFDRLLYNGNKLYPEMLEGDFKAADNEMFKVYDSKGIFTAIYKREDDIFRIKYYFGE